ncbi:hypothetical protein CR492_20110 [Methylocella silvestris]|uniref:Uncharacterized protein n=2 Tax=Methylocella silvestris TaxID=199596 RepID=A0A2J7TBQ0_METSI|nr:hypothetical protein CR492_20110 [Methylocella silvestris]
MKAKKTITLGLVDAIAAFRQSAADCLDDHAAAVLDRLSRDERAAAAFAKLGLDGAGAHGVLTACIEADEMRRTFRRHVPTRLN